MILPFSKYHGTGNDFVMVDGRQKAEALLPSEHTSLGVLSEEMIAQLCDRRFGIGADGLIVLQDSVEHDFRMRYFNADGREGSMCGNGGRCLVAFAKSLGLCWVETVFEGIDGIHSASCVDSGPIRLKLKNVEGIEKLEDGYFLDTGSPHYVRIVEGLGEMDMNVVGRGIRWEERFTPGGTNVNFLEADGTSGTEKIADRIFVRTFERGVEDETYSCGTGVTASAIVAHFHSQSDILSYTIRTLGGELRVEFQNPAPGSYTDIYLSGPAVHVFDGEVELEV